MAETEYKFPYTAEQIENKLRQVGDNTQAIEQVRKEIPKTPEAVGARPATWMPNASEVGADASGTAQAKVSEHNTSEASHNDIRLLIEGLTNRLNALANSDDTTLDQMAEVVAYIKNNKSLIDGITTNKVSVSDIIDNLTSNVSNKPLSAKQGVALKALIDAIVVPTKTSQLQNDSGFLTQHQDLSSYAKKATTLAGYGITDGATKQAVQELQETIADQLKGNVSVPEYWKEELETKADNIRVAMEKAGRNKSAFLWYTDAHWVNGNSKVSPMLLNHLYMNTPMNKVNFGGDIIGDTLLATREEMTYLYEWRKAIKDLPNHHSVFGNHDMFDLSSVDYEDDNYRYAFLLAPEETPDMVWGDGNYYYIDNPSEKTRYLYIAYMVTDHNAMMSQGKFFMDAIKSVEDGWHIVAIAHRWWQYDSTSTPTVGHVTAFESEMLGMFDAYNARTKKAGYNYFYSQDFTDAKGKVEFCIGGHIHYDYDFFTDGGIPVIITTSDANQNRVLDSTVDSGTVGTITESAVFGIIADYNEEITKITIVGVGRGTSRVVRTSSVKPTSITDITYSGNTTVESAIDKSKFSFVVNYSDGSSSSTNGATSVTPTTIGIVGNNSVTITYVENGITLSGTVTVVGTAKPVANLFDKNDSDVVLGARWSISAGGPQYYADGQLMTGFIEGKLGDTFSISSDKTQKANVYTGTLLMFDENKSIIGVGLGHDATNTGGWTWASDNLSGAITIPSKYGTNDYTNTAYLRFVIAYTDIDSIVITKS